MSPQPMLMTLMRAVRLLVPTLALIFATGCRKVQLCPPGMDVVEQRTVADRSIWCKSPDGRTAQRIDVSNGVKRQVCEYHDGLAHGPFRAFHPEGGRWIEGQYQAGFTHGLWHQWDKSGTPSADGEYRAGMLIQGAPVASAAKCEQAKP
jgi:hypothetical protein